MPNGIFVPKLLWDPGLLRRARPLQQVGELSGSPFGSLEEAFEAIATRREQRDPTSPRDNVFLTSYAASGWVVFEYGESRLGKADLKELVPDDLPLGGSIKEPQTYVVDGQGRVGRIARGSSDGAYTLREIDGANTRTTNPAPAYLPSVVPKLMVNHGKNIRWHPRFALRPGPDIEELSRALAWIHQNLPPSVKIKAGGWCHSWSPVAATDGVYIHPEGMRGVALVVDDPAEASVLDQGVDQSNLFAVLAGTRIREISSALWAKGKALPYLGGWDGQTLGGVLPTGTHGSALCHGPLAELVRSLDMVRFDGQRVRVEPSSAPLTAPARFQSKRPGWTLIQDDDVFNAMLISMGSMGVSHRFILEVRDRFWLKEMRTVTTMPDAVRVLRGGNIYHLMESEAQPSWIDPKDDRAFDERHPKPAFHLELLWNPYSDSVVVTTRHPVDGRTEFEFATGEEPSWFADAPVRNLFRVLKLDAMADQYSRPDLSEVLTEHLPNLLDEMVEIAAAVAPGIIPRFIDGGLRQMIDPEGYTQRSYKVFNVGEGANSIPAQSATLSIPLADDQWLDAICVIREVARRIAHDWGEYQTGPISLRFVRGSPILLADPVDVCKFEFIFGGDDERVRAQAEELVREHYLAVYGRFGAAVRLHWGQLTPDGTIEMPGSSGRHRVRESYPRYDDWRRIRDRFDPLGRGLNPWQERILPVVLPIVERAARRSSSRERERVR